MTQLLVMQQMMQCSKIVWHGWRWINKASCFIVSLYINEFAKKSINLQFSGEESEFMEEDEVFIEETWDELSENSV